jgi:hypothetical protein
MSASFARHAIRPPRRRNVVLTAAEAVAAHHELILTLRVLDRVYACNALPIADRPAVLAAARGLQRVAGVLGGAVNGSARSAS